jgi:hypothetical protein
MNLTNDRIRSIGWAAVLLVCFTLTVALTFRVNAVKSQVRLTERQIVAIKRDKQFLETEFQTRSNQQQLRNLNDVEFGYKAPAVGQYLEGERQLAVYGKPRSAGAPSPILVANADVPAQSSVPAMVSPLTGKAVAAEVPRQGGLARPVDAAGLDARLSQIAAHQPVPSGMRE